MENTNRAVKIIKEIENCHKCHIVDKPYIIYGPYVKYLPNQVKILVVSESPPPGYKNDFIYNVSCRDRLRNVLSYIFNVPENVVPEYLKRNNIFWTTAIKCRPVSKSYLEDMRKKCVIILRREIELLRPSVIIALGKIAWKSIDEISPQVPVLRDYHPLYVWRFCRDSIYRLRSLFLKFISQDDT